MPDGEDMRKILCRTHRLAATRRRHGLSRVYASCLLNEAATTGSAVNRKVVGLSRNGKRVRLENTFDIREVGRCHKLRAFEAA